MGGEVKQEHGKVRRREAARKGAIPGCSCDGDCTRLSQHQRTTSQLHFRFPSSSPLSRFRLCPLGCPRCLTLTPSRRTSCVPASSTPPTRRSVPSYASNRTPRHRYEG